MKKLLIIAWCVFFTGLIFRLFNFPFSSILLILGTLLLVVHSIIYLIKNAKSKMPSALLYLSFAFITMYILFRLQFWSCGPGLFGVSLFFVIVLSVVIACFILHIIKKYSFRLLHLFFIIYFVSFFILSFVHSYSIYYFFNLNPLLRSDTRNTNYHAWDKYSWFLYIAGKQDEAIEANHNAENAVVEKTRYSFDKSANTYHELIIQHRQQLQNKSWRNYP